MTFMERLLRGMRDSIPAGTFAAHGEQVLGGQLVR
jgi:hypothetical protein